MISLSVNGLLDNLSLFAKRGIKSDEIDTVLQKKKVFKGRVIHYITFLKTY